MSQNLTTFGYTMVGSTSLDGYLLNPSQDDINVNGYDVNNVGNLTAEVILATDKVHIRGTPGNGDNLLSIENASGFSRWGIGIVNNEGNSNVGSDLNVFAYSNSGGYLSSPLLINRANGGATLSGNVVVNQNLSVEQNVSVGGNLSVGGSIATTGIISSALNVASVQNPGTSSMTISVSDVNKLIPCRAGSSGMTVNLPDPVANNLPLGSFFRIVNNHSSSGIITVADPTGITTNIGIDESKTFVVVALASGSVQAFYTIC